MTGSAAALSPARLETVAGRAEQWADFLVDLSYRNSLLNYKDSKTSTLDLTSADPSALARLLTGQKVRLAALTIDQEELDRAAARARALRKTIIALEEEQGIDAGRLAIGLIRVTSPARRGSSPVPPLRAPLLLRRITFAAKTAAETDFTLELADEADPNPVLLYALAQQHGLDVDELEGQLREALSESATPTDQAKRLYDLLDHLLSPFGSRLEFEPRIVAGVFSFEKMPMVEDLRSSTELLAEHDIIAAIAGDAAATYALQTAQPVATPHTDEIPPAAEYLVQDADSSQQAAIEAAINGQHIVIDGPPGTGKSQTIANIIAVMAARGRKVLFVAEKRAAIEAVTDRLAKAGLDRLVFDLHQQKINKKQVAARLQEALGSASRELPPDVTELHEQLARARHRAREYQHELHRTHAPWNLSAYDAQARILALPPTARTRIRFRGSTLQRLSAPVRSEVSTELQDFISRDGVRIRRGVSPWSRSKVRDADAVRGILATLDQLTTTTLSNSRRELEGLLNRAGLQRPPDLAGWQWVLDLLDGVARTVDAFGDVIFGSELDDLHWATGDRAFRQEQPRGISFFRRRALVKRARQLHRHGVRQPEALHKVLAAAVNQRERWQRLTVDGRPPSSLPGLEGAMQHFRDLQGQLAAVSACAQLSDLSHQPTPQVQQLLDDLDSAQQDLMRMPRFNRASDLFRGLGLDAFLDELIRRDPSPEQAAALFEHAWLCSVLDELKLRVPALGDFVGTQHSRSIEDFRRADQTHIQRNAARVRREVGVRLRKVRDANPDQDGVIRKQAALKSKHLPMRKLVAQAPDVLLAVYPCWAMSPLVVSRTLPALRLFDVVIFDEASQVPPQDAMPSIMRGKQLIVAGDDKQLPPTNFFRRVLASGDEDDEDDEDTDSHDEGLEFYESILKRLQGLLPARQQHRLRWHYRSLDERLIAFSNTEIYDNDLVTFPGIGVEPPIELDVVDGAAMPGQDGSNPQEVTRVVELVLDHAAKRSAESLGVITMGLKHANRVEAALRQIKKDRPDLDEFFSDEVGPGKRFFIKSIERVQGDERDAIILSVGYAKNGAGRLPMRFGALNQSGGERRLNVAVTRARRRMTVVSSFSHFDMDATATASAAHDGPELLRRFLQFADRHGDAEALTHSRDVELNGFEQAVLTALTQRGIAVHPQWGVSDYRIDFALAHPDRPGQMVLAVETDGASYHASASARDRDRLRQDHLQRLGWRFHRIWSTDWFRDPEGETARVVERWRQASQEADGDPMPGEDTPSLAEVEGPSEAVIIARGPRPRVPKQARITDYSETELYRVCLWLLRDQLALPREDRVNQAIKELGFQNRGRIIVERVTAALLEAQRTIDIEEQN